MGQESIVQMIAQLLKRRKIVNFVKKNYINNLQNLIKKKRNAKSAALFFLQILQ